MKKVQNYNSKFTIRKTREVAPKHILSLKQVKPKKSWGQHFLVSQEVLRDLLAAAELEPQDTVLEIGAGTGVITVELARRVKRVIAVEKDPRLAAILREELHAHSVDNVQIVNQDILKLQMSDNKYQINAECQTTGVQVKCDKILGAIPYQITSPLIHKLLKELPPNLLIVLVIQNEVAEKIAAQPPEATYLSNFVSALAKVKLVGGPVAPSSFRPPPRVKSRIIKLVTRNEERVRREEIQRFEDFLHKGFSRPRKMLKNVFDEGLLRKAGIDPSSRPQELTLEEWLLLNRGGSS